MENKNSSISVTDVVNLIIEKNIKKIDDIIAEKRNMIDELEEKARNGINEKVEKLKSFLTEHFDEKGLNHFIRITPRMRVGGYEGMWIGGRGGTGNEHDLDPNRVAAIYGQRTIFNEHDVRIQLAFKELFLCGLMLKGDDAEYVNIKSVEKELSDLYNKRDEIRDSKSALIAEVTLQRLSSIDVDFSDKLDLLADKIFNNRQEPKLID